MERERQGYPASLSILVVFLLISSSGLPSYLCFLASVSHLSIPLSRSNSQPTLSVSGGGSRLGECGKVQQRREHVDKDVSLSNKAAYKFCFYCLMIIGCISSRVCFGVCICICVFVCRLEAADVCSEKKNTVAFDYSRVYNLYNTLNLSLQAGGKIQR